MDSPTSNGRTTPSLPLGSDPPRKPRRRPASLTRLARAPPADLSSPSTTTEHSPVHLLTTPLRFIAFLLSLGWVDWRARRRTALAYQQHHHQQRQRPPPSSPSWISVAARWWDHTPGHRQSPTGRWRETDALTDRHSSDQCIDTAVLRGKVRRVVTDEVDVAFESWGQVQGMLVVLAVVVVGGSAWVMREAWARVG